MKLAKNLFCYLKVIHIVHLCYHPKIIGPVINNKQNNKDVLFMGCKGTHREKGPWDETPALRESMNTEIWVVGTLSQLFIRGSKK